VIVIGTTLYRDVLLDDSECMDMLILLDLEIIRIRSALANTNNRGAKQMYMQKLKSYGGIADRIRFSHETTTVGLDV
jgi:hypothetical protein